MNRKTLAAAITVGAVALVATGCDVGESGHDAGVKDRNDVSRHVYNMPDGTPNITAFCSYGNLVYISSRNNGGGFIVVENDSAKCTGVDDGGVPHA